MIEIQVTREMWDEWLRSPVTKMFFQGVADHQREAQRQILEYNLNQENYKKLQGMYTAYKNVLETHFEEENYA